MNIKEFKTTRRNALKIISTAIVALIAVLSSKFTKFFEQKKRLIKLVVKESEKNVQVEREVFINKNNGQLQVLLRTCPHLGCKVKLNEEKNRFVCPCHGSQFRLDGTYVKGPAGRDLFKADFEQTKNQLIVKL